MLDISEDFNNGTHLRFLIFSLQESNFEEENIFLICIMNGTKGNCCTFLIDDNFLNQRFEEKLRLPSGDAQELANWILDNQQVIIDRA